MVGCAEVGQGVGLVVANGIQLNTGLYECFVSPLQLDQLRAAGWSPDCGPKEDDHRGLARPVTMKVDRRVVVVASDDVRERGANIGPGRELSLRITSWPVAGLHRPGKAVDVQPELSGARVRRGFDFDLHGQTVLTLPDVVNVGGLLGESCRVWDSDQQRLGGVDE